jgi:hypothetical protein
MIGFVVADAFQVEGGQLLINSTAYRPFVPVAMKYMVRSIIVVIDGEAFWVKLDWSDFGRQISALKVADKHNKGVGQYTLIVVPALKDLEQEIWETAKQSKTIDIKSFTKRTAQTKKTA